MSLTVLPAPPGSDAFRAFLGAAALVRGDDPQAPALPPELVEAWLSPDAPWRRHGEAQPFVALRGDRPVGAVLASVDGRAPHGCFGFFDCVNEEATARALLSPALSWLKEHGAARVEGPIQLHALAGYRFQISGHERAPFLGEPRNPAWYPGLVEQLGFTPGATWRTWDFEGWRLWAMRAYDRLQSRKNGQLRRQGYRTVELNRDNFDEEMERIYPVVMACYVGAPAFWPLDLDEYTYFNFPLKLAPGVRGCILRKDGSEEALGFGVGIQEAERGILHSFGILREHRGKRLAHLVMEHAFVEVRRLHLKQMVGALVKEGHNKYDEIGGAPTRRYALYRRDTSPLGGGP